ncbi:MAG: helix-turn-helix domain-containing protein [Proteobacteria bacterium]|nr:helix-turn-helix domain-containing protein [Pseudomonadota bacterium]
MHFDTRVPTQFCPDDLLTTFEAAQVLRLSVPTLERMRLAGNGPIFIKLGPGKRARVVYRRADLDTWLLAHRRGSTSQRGSMQ